MVDIRPPISDFYKYGISFRIFFDSAAATSAEWRRFRLRFFPLLDSRWPLKPLARLILPLPVTLNLFIAPLLLLILGTCISFIVNLLLWPVLRVAFEPDT